LDRLARSTYHLTRIAHDLKETGVGLKVLDQAIDTTTVTGKLLFDMLSAIAEFETSIRKERQLEGINLAKSRGVQFGRKAKLNVDQIAEMKRQRKDGVLIKDLMAEYELSKASVYRLLA
jgi:DNA invertase Pin-like site-specific DNA recombinase